MRIARFIIEDIMCEDGTVDILEPDDNIGSPNAFVYIDYSQSDTAEDTLASYFRDNATHLNWLQQTFDASR